MSDETPAPEGQVWICQACGKTARARGAFREASCRTWAVLVYEEKTPEGKWVAVPELADVMITGTVTV